MTPSSTRLHIVYALFTLYKWRDISNWMVFTMSRTLVDESNIRPVYNIVLSSEIYFSNSRLVLGNVWTSWAFILLLYLILTSKKFGSNFSYCGKCNVDDDEPFCSIDTYAGRVSLLSHSSVSWNQNRRCGNVIDDVLFFY